MTLSTFLVQSNNRYFRQTKLTSFQRQLNLYGFRRLTQSTDAGAYYHELFLRGRPQLCLRMVRQKVKGTGHKQPADAQTEPNFYALPPVSAGSGSAGTSPMVSPALSAAAAPSSPRGSASPGSSVTRSHHLEMSPGTQCVHGAAFLLKGIAAGVAPSRLSNIESSAAVASIGSPEMSPALDASVPTATGNRAASGFSLSYRGNPHGLQSYHGQTSVASGVSRQIQEHSRAAFSASPPPKSSYSSLLWGGEAAKTPNETSQSAANTPPQASFLWPQSATAQSATSRAKEEESSDRFESREAV